MRLPGLFYKAMCAALLCGCLTLGAGISAQAAPGAEKQSKWVVFTPLKPPYTIMRIVKVMGAIQTGKAYTRQQMDITYEYRAAVNDGLAGCTGLPDDQNTAYFVTTLDDRVHEVKFSRAEDGSLVATPDSIMVGPHKLSMKWGCFRNKIFLANLKGESAVGPEACRTPIPYAYCDMNGLIFWQLPEWDGDVVPAAGDEDKDAVAPEEEVAEP